MPQIGTWLLANIFSALLPTIDLDERDFYTILDVPRDATNEQIRKAYKVKSLKLHPDKVAQRHGNKDEAAAEYELVQEAYAVLVNDEKRQRYHALRCSPTRFRFVAQGALSNPGALYENLTHARMLDKTRLVLLCTVFVLLVLLQPILIATKVNHIVEETGSLEETNWTVVLIPFWTMGAFWILFWIMLLGLAPSGTKGSVLLTVLEYFCWYLGLMFQALKWDGTWTSDYSQVLVPVYLAMIFRWVASMALLQKVRYDVGRMVTVDYLEREVLQGKSLEEMTEAEQEAIRTNFLIISVPSEFEPYEEEPEGGADADPEPLSEKDLEAQKVEASHEYEAATDFYNSVFGGLLGSLVFGIIFLIVLTLKLDRKIDASYWVVFIPVWIYYGSRWIYNCYRCACATVSGDEILLNMNMPDEDEGSDGGDGEDHPEDQAASTSTSKDRIEDEMFVDPASSISKFNNETSARNEQSENVENPTTKDEPFKDVKAKKTEKKGKKANKEKKEEELQEPASGSDEKTALEKAGEKETKDDEEKEAAISGDDDEDPIHIDEDTFRAWQSAYDEAERGAMEEQSKASMEWCSLSIQLMVIVMVVAKIDKNYDNDNPNDAGFNAFWILFPFFLFFGLILCCCACLIYGAAPGSAADLNGDDNDEAADVEDQPTSTPNIMEPHKEEQPVSDEGPVYDNVEQVLNMPVKKSEDPAMEDLD